MPSVYSSGFGDIPLHTFNRVPPMAGKHAACSNPRGLQGPARCQVHFPRVLGEIFSTQGPVVYEAGPFIYIRNAAFFLNFADLLLQEQDERISGDCLGTFFLKFRGPAVARAR